jgi:hypothetical protein
VCAQEQKKFITAEKMFTYADNMIQIIKNEPEQLVCEAFPEYCQARAEAPLIPCSVLEQKLHFKMALLYKQCGYKRAAFKHFELSLNTVGKFDHRVRK